MRFPAFAHFCWFIKERESIRLKKEKGLPRPWTVDPTLDWYRFCNVRREDDYETRWIATHWRSPCQSNPEVWFAMCVARIVNWHPTLEELGYPVPWKPAQFKKVLAARAEREEQVFTGAYMINQSIPGGKGVPKGDYVADFVLDPLWEGRKLFGPSPLSEFHAKLTAFKGMGSFMAAQVVADTKYTLLLSGAPDWHTWAASGPGSRRGMNLLLGQPADAPWAERAWKEAMDELRPQVNKITKLELHAQDVQNCLCEYSKYVRGSSRSHYQPRS